MQKAQRKAGWCVPCACCLVSLLAVACGSNDKSTNAACATDIVGRQTLRGHYTVSFEHWMFRTCDGNTVIAVDPNSLSQAKGVDQVIQAQKDACSAGDAGTACGDRAPMTIFTEIVADVSPLGVYGHLGEVAQELKVIEFLSASATSPSDCPKVDTTVVINRRPECQK
jgi:hypothetical protein